jgi:hypothetical protein
LCGIDMSRSAASRPGQGRSRCATRRCSTAPRACRGSRRSASPTVSPRTRPKPAPPDQAVSPRFGHSPLRIPECPLKSRLSLEQKALRQTRDGLQSGVAYCFYTVPAARHGE